MKSSIKIEIAGDSVRVSVRLPDWERAAARMVEFRTDPPDGYKLTEARVSPRGSSGKSNNLRMTFVHCDERVPPFSLDEAYSFFRREFQVQEESQRASS